MPPLFLAALIAGASYYAERWIGVPAPLAIAWKGSGVALLALWAAREARSRDGWWIAEVLAFGALGDVLLETSGIVTGAVAFLIGHVSAVALYLRHRRGGPALLVVAAVALATAIVAWLLPDARGFAPGVAVYALGLGAMAGSALVSRFPASVPLGALLFVTSDLLLFARMGPLAESAVAGLLVWPSYFAGQALIAWGVVQGLRESARRGEQ